MKIDTKLAKSGKDDMSMINLKSQLGLNLDDQSFSSNISELTREKDTGNELGSDRWDLENENIDDLS